MRARATFLLAAAAFCAAASAFAQEAGAPRTLTTTDGAAREQPSRTVTAEAAAATAGESITLGADTSQGFARVLFRWPRPVTFTANIADGILVVTFARPFRLPPDRASLPLDDYVSIIRQDSDLKTLRLSLKQKVRLHTSTGGPVVAIDLLPLSYAGEPAAIADPTAKPPPAPKGVVNVKLAIGVERDRTRLAFDWFENVGYDAKLSPGKISVTFAREGKIDIARLNENPPAFVKGARVSAGDNKTLLEIDVDPGSPLKHFRNKNRIVFDIGAPVNDGDDEPQVVLPEGLEPEAKKEAAGKEAEPQDAEPHDAAEEHGAEPHDVAEAAPAVPDEEHKDAHAEPPPPPSEGTDKREPPKGSDAAAVEGTHADDASPQPRPAEDGGDEAAEPAQQEPLPDKAPAFAVARERNAITMTLPLLDRDGAAMFKRGDTVFIVLDGAPAIDPAALTKNRDLVASASATTVDGATVLAIRLLKPFAVTAGQDHRGWTASLSPDPLEPPRPVALLRDARSVGPARVRATLARSTRTVRLDDPDTGEGLIAVLASGEPQGVVGARSYVEFAADATAQGLLVRALADDVTVSLAPEDVTISTPSGLTLSAGAVSDYAPGRSGIGNARAPAAMDFAAWKGDAPFLEERSRLVNAITGDEAAIERGRLNLARFYLANGLGAEALGELQLIVSDDEPVTSDPAFRALRGTALLLLGRDEAAAAELATPGLDEDPSAQLLRGLAAVEQEQWAAGRDAIAGSQNAIGAFTPDWQARFRVAGARAAVETNAVDIADRMLAAMPEEGVPLPQALEADLVRGQLAQKLKRDDEALRLYGKVKDSNYRPLAVRAALAEIILKEKTGALKRPDAIEALDELRWQWRGDGIELAILHRLGSLQIASGDYRAGLQTMRAAVLGFPKADEGRRISAEMAAVFEDLFLHGKADAMPPIQALGLYYDFRELTPIGAMGDEMVRKLADRLISVDLLEQAEELLQHQVDKRLDGVARAQIAAKLAAVYLMDQKPQKALAALRSSSQTRLPDDIAAQRRLLTGRALSDLKQYDAALEAFEQDDSPEARRLRADVQWAGSRWPEAAAALEVLLDGREKSERKLDTIERVDVLRAAVAYTMAEDEPGLDGLRARFLTLMADTPEAAAFEMVTRAVDPAGVGFRDVAKSVAAVDTLDAFLQSLGLGKPAPGSASAK